MIVGRFKQQRKSFGESSRGTDEGKVGRLLLSLLLALSREWAGVRVGNE